ncbi:MAG: SMR family transporter [Chitinophagales bacterium]|nr:SMR family transporter [Chitinophagales bacterium]
MAWIYLFIASSVEIAWLYAVKFLNFNEVVKIEWSQFFSSSKPILTLLPLLAYIVLGLTNVYFFSSAMKSIPTALAFAVWTGTALVGSKLVDTFVFKEQITWLQVLFLAFIIVGIIGLRVKSA